MISLFPVESVNFFCVVSGYFSRVTQRIIDIVCNELSTSEMVFERLFSVKEKKKLLDIKSYMVHGLLSFRVVRQTTQNRYMRNYLRTKNNSKRPAGAFG